MKTKDFAPFEQYILGDAQLVIKKSVERGKFL